MYKKNFLLINSTIILIVLAACSSNNKTSYVKKTHNTPRQVSTNIALSQTQATDSNFDYEAPIMNEAVEPTGSEPASNEPITSNFEKPKNHSTYSTKFNTKDKGRTNNITVAANSIDGTVLQPNEVFSYNNTVGPTIKRRGYKVARIFKNGMDSKGFGGGVCQVSSTLYNTAELFGMEIIERHPHSKEVKYVPKDRDAATSYGGVDLKFKNTKDYPVRIEAGVFGDTLKIDMVGV